MKASIPRLMCGICLLVFMASIIIFVTTDIIGPYAFMIICSGSVVVFLYFLTDIILEDNHEDDEKKK